MENKKPTYKKPTSKKNAPVKLKKDRFIWTFPHSTIPELNQIYIKFEEIAKSILDFKKLRHRFEEQFTQHLVKHYQKQKELPDKNLYGEYEKMIKNDTSDYYNLRISHKYINKSSTTPLKKFKIIPRRSKKQGRRTTT